MLRQLEKTEEFWSARRYITVYFSFIIQQETSCFSQIQTNLKLKITIIIS